MRLFFLLSFLPTLLAAQSAFLKNPDIVWAAEIEQDWSVDFPSLEDEGAAGVTTLKLLRTKESEAYYSSLYLADLVFQAALRGQLPIFKDPECLIPADAFEVYPDKDTIMTFDPETYEEKRRVVYVEPQPFYDFKAWRLRQVLTYRTKTATWHTQVQAIAPLININNERGDSIGTRPLFWFRPDEKRPKLTASPIVWAKRTVNRQAKTQVPIASMKPQKTVGGTPELLLCLQDLVEKRMGIPLHDADGELLSIEMRQSMLHRSDTIIHCFSEEPNTVIRLELLDRVHYLQLLQTWYWDARRHRLSICLDAVAPLSDVLDNEDNFRFRRPLFYQRTRQ
jgi:hypothetical protein